MYPKDDSELGHFPAAFPDGTINVLRDSSTLLGLNCVDSPYGNRLWGANCRVSAGKCPSLPGSAPVCREVH